MRYALMSLRLLLLRRKGSLAANIAWVAFLSLVFAASASNYLLQAQASTTPALTIDGLGKGAVALDGPWQFHLGDDPSFASPTIDDSAGHAGWEPITAGAPWGAQGHRSYTGYAWYRRHLHLTPAPGASPNFSLLITRIEDLYEIYWNGVLVAHNGTMPPNPSWRYTQPAQTFDLGPIRDGVLAIRVWKGPLASFESGLQGGFYAPPIIGSSTAVADRKSSLDYHWLHARQYIFGLQSLYALVMVLSLLVWLRDRSQRALLWMAGFCFSPLVLTVLDGLQLGWSYKFALGWIQPVLSLHDISLWFLLLYLLQLNENPRLVRLTRWLAIVSIVATSLDGLLTFTDWSAPHFAPWVQTADAMLTVIFTTAEAYPIVLVAFALPKRLDPARWLVALFAFLTEMLSVVRIAVQQGSRFTHWTFGDSIAKPLFTINDNPFSAQRLADTGLLLAIIYAVYRYSREAIQRQQVIEQELRSAQELQHVLIPESLPSLPGYAITSAYRPAQEVGGDFF